jgi:hypothetical protein
LNDDQLSASDIVSLNVTYEVTTSSGGNGGKGQIEAWLVNPCLDEAIQIIGPYCVNSSGDPNDLACEEQGLFSPVFVFQDPCRPAWNNNLMANNMGVSELYSPYADVVGGNVTLGDQLVTAVSNIADFDCADINGTWYLFSVKDNSENASIKFISACLETCPEAYTKEVTATDACGQSSSASYTLVRDTDCLDCGDTWYVDADAAGASTGMSWANAFNDLQDALAVARPGDEIWVAEGTYYPTASDDRTATFNLYNRVEIYGGFAGTETMRSARDPENNPAILSGNIDGGGREGNSYHVVTILACVGDSGAGVLDGLTIQEGYANGTGTMQDVGAGVLCQGVAILRDVRIMACEAVNGGAAIYNDGMDARLTIEDCDIDAVMTESQPVILNVNGAQLNTIGTTNTTK